MSQPLSPSGGAATDAWASGDERAAARVAELEALCHDQGAQIAALEELLAERGDFDDAQELQSVVEAQDAQLMEQRRIIEAQSKLIDELSSRMGSAAEASSPTQPPPQGQRRANNVRAGNPEQAAAYGSVATRSGKAGGIPRPGGSSFRELPRPRPNSALRRGGEAAVMHGARPQSLDPLGGGAVAPRARYGGSQ